MKENDIYSGIDYNDMPYLMYVVNVDEDSYNGDDITYCKINKGVCLSESVSHYNFNNRNMHFIENRNIQINDIKNLDLDYPEVFI